MEAEVVRSVLFRIAGEVRRALIAAAKMAPVVVAMDAAGCVSRSDACASQTPVLLVDAGEDGPLNRDAGPDGGG